MSVSGCTLFGTAACACSVWFGFKSLFVWFMRLGRLFFVVFALRVMLLCGGCARGVTLCLCDTSTSTKHSEDKHACDLRWIPHQSRATSVYPLPNFLPHFSSWRVEINQGVRGVLYLYSYACMQPGCGRGQRRADGEEEGVLLLASLRETKGTVFCCPLVQFIQPIPTEEYMP